MSQPPLIVSLRAALARGALEQARALMAEISKTTDAAEAHLRFARFFWQRRLFPPSLEHFRRAQELAPSVHVRDSYADGARVQHQIRNTDDAIALLNEGLKRFPKDAKLSLIMVQVQAQSKKTELAIASMATAIAAPNLPKSYADLVTLSFRSLLKSCITNSDNLASARDLLNTAVTKFPSYYDLRRVQAEQLIEMAQYETAIANLAEVHGFVAPGPKRDAVVNLLRVAYTKSNQQIPAEFAETSPLAAPAIHKEFVVAAITNAYNEQHNLPIWLDHYGKQVGIEKCIVLDHGSTDGSTNDLKGAGIMRLHRAGVHVERHRMQLITNLANDLLNYYDAVIYTDCDEMLVADPEKYENLVDYARTSKRAANFAIGLNVRHDPKVEQELDPAQSYLSQRTLVQFVNPMCKPNMIKKPVTWGGGFHTCEQLPNFDDLYLFHLRHGDLRQALDRMGVTREIVYPTAGAHSRYRRTDDDVITSNFDSTSRLAVNEDWDFSAFLDAHIASCVLSPQGLYIPTKDIRSPYLSRVPERFRNVF